MWFAYTDNFANWHMLKIDQVREIIAQNKEKKRVSSLEDFALEITQEEVKDFNNAMGQESLTRFDQPKKKKNNKNKNRKPNGDRPQQQNANQNQKPANQNSEKPQQNGNQKHPNKNHRNPNNKITPVNKNEPKK